MNLLIIISTIIALLLGIFAILKSNDSQLVYAYTAGLSATFIGVLLGFFFNGISIDQSNKAEFESLTESLNEEFQKNKTTLRSYSEKIDGKSFHYSFLSTNALDLLLEKEFTYKYGGASLRRLLLANKYRISSFKMVYARAESFNASRNLEESEVEQLRQAITRVEFLVDLTLSYIADFDNDSKYFTKKATDDKLKSILNKEKEYLVKYGKNAYENLKKDKITNL